MTQQAQPLARVIGGLMGYRPVDGGGRRDIVVVTEELRPRGGPAVKSVVSVVTSAHGDAVASYVPWYNYSDLDIINQRESGVWTIVEPAEPYDREVVWWPYGGN